MMDKLGKYLVLCDMADELLAKYKPCAFHADGSCYRSRIMGKMRHCCYGVHYFIIPKGKCKLLGSMGCTTKCLGCKLWICSFIRNKYPELSKDLDYLLQLAINEDLNLNARITTTEATKK